MKLSLASKVLSFSLAALCRVGHGQGLGHYPHVWLFTSQGVNIYEADGSELVKVIPPERACHNMGNATNPDLRCYWADVVSDGHKYVWASISRGKDMIDVFNIDSGSLVGSFGTCGSPRDLDFHPSREEIWVHCSDFSAMKESHMDVFSTVTPSAGVETRILMHNNTEARSYGVVVVDEALGDVGYATVYGQKYIYKVSLAERMVEQQISVDNGEPRLSGVYDMAFSPVNQHLYLRTQVCCTCGFQGADMFECGRYGSENVTILGEVTEGQCGRHCEGSSADNIGIIEYDTILDKIVGTHPFSSTGAAVDAPFTSPDGDRLVVPSLNGGQNIEIWTPGQNGELTTEKETLDLDFETAVDEEIAAYDDFAWVQTNGIDLFVLASSIDFKVAIADMSKSPPSVSYVTLDPSQTWPEDARASSRQVEWIEGTDFVWISGPVEQQTYVLDVRKKTILKTFKGIDVNKILSVVRNSFHSASNSDSVSMIETATVNSGSAVGSGSGTTESRYDYNIGSTEAKGSAAQSSFRSASDNNDNYDSSSASDGLAIAALAVSCLALVAVITNFVISHSHKQSKSDDSLAGKRSEMPPSVA